MFKVFKKSRKSKARLGIIKTPHGVIHTPAFLPVATRATVKSLTSEDIKEIGYEAVLANTYHLYLRPGHKIVKKLGGLHRFMNWSGPLVTDSGGFQVFSLGSGLENNVGKVLKGEAGKEKDISGKKKLVKIDRDGVDFVSHLDGSRHRLTPEKSVQIQEDLGADIIFAFDECSSPLDDYDYTKKAMIRTHQWAERCLKVRKPARGGSKGQALFGIVQGGVFEDLRKQSAKFIGELGFDGFGIGGSLGEKEMYDILDWTIPCLPENKPRHLLGIGYLDNIKESVKRGIDLFDCVYPTRLARHGVLLTNRGEISILKGSYKTDKKPVIGGYTRAYLHHLFKNKEMLGPRLATWHNLWFIKDFFDRIKEDIKRGKV